MQPTLKCVVVGDGSVGKTCLLIRYAKDDFPTAYIPTIFDSYAVSLPIGDETYELHLFDTAGQEDFDQLRRLAFTNTDILLVCFAVDYWPSFINVREMWIPELRKYCPGVPYILVGTRIDLRNDQKTIEKLAAEGKNPVSIEQGKKLATELRAVMYVECSALTKENVENVFQEAIVTALSDYGSSIAIEKVHTSGSYNPSSFNNNNHHNSSNNNNSSAPPEKDINLCCCSCCAGYCNTQNCTVL